MNVKLNFFVPGFSKCGTTTLFKILNHHPEIFIPEAKEPNYFGSSPTKERTAWFNSIYADSTEGQLKGDCSTFYSSIYSEKEASREIYRNNANAKLIFIARDPIDRIESSFREMHNSAPKYGLNTPFLLEDALREMPQILADTSFYSRVKVYQDTFGVENILILLMEELKIDVGIVAKRCYEFLGVDPIEFSREMLPHMNRGEEKLYDSKLFRRARCSPLVGPWLSKVPVVTQDRFAVKFGLRKPFSEPVSWSDKAEMLIEQKLVPDIERFISEVGISRDVWPRYQALCKRIC